MAKPTWLFGCLPGIVKLRMKWSRRVEKRVMATSIAKATSGSLTHKYRAIVRDRLKGRRFPPLRAHSNKEPYKKYGQWLHGDPDLRASAAYVLGSAHAIVRVWQECTREGPVLPGRVIERAA